MSTELVACEFEDSTNCFWNAQEQGNGIGDSFIDIEGETFYIETTPKEVPEVVVEVPVLEELPVLEEVPEVVVEVPVIVDPMPEELAITGTVDVVVGLLLGLALLTAGVVLFIKGKKNHTV